MVGGYGDVSTRWHVLLHILPLLTLSGDRGFNDRIPSDAFVGLLTYNMKYAVLAARYDSSDVPYQAEAVWYEH